MEISELMKKAKARYDAMTPEEKARMMWDQRISFVYGNLALDDPSITREQVVEAATKIYGPRP